MTCKKLFLVMAMFGMTMAAFAQTAGKQYFLVDSRTQMPVLCYPMLPNWLHGGKTNWTTEPATPVNWHVWAMGHVA